MKKFLFVFVSFISLKAADPIHDYQLFEKTYAIHNFINKLLQTKGKECGTTAGYTKFDPNPFGGRTEQGLFLDLSYSIPHLYSPWGDLGWIGHLVEGGSQWREECSMKAINKEILKELDAKISQEKSCGKLGCYGPIYKINKSKDTPLPAAVILNKRTSSEQYEEIMKVWKKMKRRYQARGGYAQDLNDRHLYRK